MNIEEKYPGMTEFLRIGGISAQSQTKHAIRTATDQRGEQTINKDAKTTGIFTTIIYNNSDQFKGNSFGKSVDFENRQRSILKTLFTF